jgi:hypothetical protein
VRPQEWVEAAVTVARTFGLRGAYLRARHEWRTRRNGFRAAPLHPLTSLGAPLPGFAVPAAALRDAVAAAVARARAEAVVAGTHEAFRWEPRALPATAAAWNASPDGIPWQSGELWWRVRHYAPGRDIKDVWEPARFAWLYDLVRGWAVCGDARYVQCAAEHVAGFLEACPPFRGPQWVCGQETSIRAIALLYAEAAFHGHAAWEPVRARVVQALAASGERVADAIGYAISQRNNHGISEAVGLLVLGHRFEGTHPEAERWRLTGQRWMARLVAEQFATDGWYIQHSFTYLRVAVDQCIVASRVAPLSAAVRARLAAAAALLVAVVDPATGIVPNHGNNDGAFVHPITSAPYRDFRPTLTALSVVTGTSLPANLAPDAETLAWLGRELPESGPPLGDGVWQGTSGWASGRLGDTFVFLRAGAYHSRPGHLDTLHLDVRAGGREIVVDPGTYRYVRDEAMPVGLDLDVMHNGPTVDGWTLGRRGPRFLWYRWPQACVTIARRDEATLELGGRAGKALTRHVLVRAGCVDVTDTVPAGLGSIARWRWLLGPGTPATAITLTGTPLVSAATSRDTGWFSPQYGERLSAPAVAVAAAATGGVRLQTTILTSADSRERSS